MALDADGSTTMTLSLSGRGSYYVRTRTLVLVFKPAESGVIITVLDRLSNRRVGSLFLSTWDLRALIEHASRVHARTGD